MAIDYAVGAYRCEVIDHSLGKTSKGNPQFVVRFTVLEQENGTPVTQLNRTFYRPITDNTMQYLLEDLDALQFPHVDRFSDLDSRNGRVDFRGQVVTMWCKHGKDLNGNPREEWSVARKMQAVEQLEPQESMKLDALFGKALKGRNGAAPSQPSTTRFPMQPRTPQPQLAPAQSGPAPGDGWVPSDDDVPW